MIKYHDNMNGKQYGSDHKLTNNWNPDVDYGNEYVKVYFRTKTPSYAYLDHAQISVFKTEEDRIQWREEVEKFIYSLGMKIDCGYEVYESKEKYSYLFPHPQSLSGVVLKNDVKKIAEGITKLQYTTLDWVDLYDTIYNITDDEYVIYLDTKKRYIRELLFEKAKTNRTTHYWRVSDITRIVATDVKLNRLGVYDQVEYGSGMTVEYILKVVDEMLSEGLLKCVESKKIKHIRSINKTEQKKLKLHI